MIAFTIDEVAEAVGGTARGEATVTGIAVDSRAVERGDLFVGLPGTRVDGAAFAADALASGAAAVLIRTGTVGMPAVEVADPVLALGRLAGAVRRRSSARLVAIAGSTGKTSTKDILRALVEPHHRVVASHENQNTEIGVPLTMGRVEDDTEVVIAELAMRGTGQVDYLARMTLPDVAVMTAIGPEHLELLGSIEDVAAANAEVFAHLAADGTAVVPHGEPLLEPYLRDLRQRVVTYGEAAGADVRLLRFQRAGAGGEAEIGVSGRTVTVAVNFTSHHNALNLTAAAAAYDALGLPLEELGRGAASVRFSRWRGEELQLPGGGLLIADCYNANPTSMRAAIRHLSAVAEGRRRVAVLGDMAELGQTGPAFHEEIGRLLAEEGIEEVAAVGPLSRAYGGTWFPDRSAALDGLEGLIRPGDAVLVKGSRSMGLEELVEAIAP